MGSIRRKWTVLIVIGMLLSISTGCPGPARKQQPGIKAQQEPRITLFVNETGATKDINIEEYLAGVVAAEMETNWPVEALAAQAIIARTFTMKKIQDGGVKEHGTDASTSVEEFQAYAPEKINQRVRQAVNKTRGMVVVYQGKYINGWFFADAGGRTAASAAEGLSFFKEKTPYIKSVADPGAKITAAENRFWKVQFSEAEVARAVKEITGKDIGALRSVQIIERGPSNRVTKIRLGTVEVGAPALRLALGSDRLRSTMIESLNMTNNGLIATGKGFGHGVGMSQWGARALAQQGKQAEDIIKYFYHDVSITRAWK